jgi:DNA polymerase-1
MTEIAELIGHGGAGKTHFTMRDVPLEIAARYAAADADATFRLARAQQPRLKARDLERLLYDVEFPLVPVLADMELTGVAIDAPYLGALSVELGQRMAALQREIYAQAGKPFNVGSTEQVANVLYRVLGLPVQTRSDGERLTTSAWALEDLRGKHPIVPMVLEYRELSKLKGTYADALPALVNPRTGRVHTTFNQGVVITGRLSSSNPNLQNIPIVSEMGRRVRKAFVAQPGGEVLSADYSQVELRILAHLASDPMLREAFERDEDIHKSTAAAIYNVPLADVTTEQRGFAKRVNFGIAYGMGARSLAASANMTERQAEQFIAQYFRRFSRVKAWLDGTRREMNTRHSVQTLFGRRRPFDDMRGKSVGERNRAERLAINHPVQGTAAEVIKLAMIKLHARLSAGGYASRITLQVHDELVLDVAPGELPDVRELVREEMETALPLNVRLKAEVAVGPNWDDAE